MPILEGVAAHFAPSGGLTDPFSQDRSSLALQCGGWELGKGDLPAKKSG